MNNKFYNRWPPNSIYALVLIVILAAALWLRVVPRLDQVFGDGWVRFGEVDPWYHVRLVENLLQHFPSQIAFDPYSFYPHGQTVQFAPFYDLMIGIVAWVLGCGSPDQHTTEVIAAYFPAVLGALMVVPVFFIGKELFGKKAGLYSAALVAILPGNYLARSLLGVTDHHIGEVFLSTLAAMFLILAVKRARESARFQDTGSFKPGGLSRLLLLAVISGLCLGLYIATWVGGLLFALFVFVYCMIQFIYDHMKGISTAYLSIIAIPLFLVALLVIIPFLGKGGLSVMHPFSLAVAALVLGLAGIFSRLLEKKRLKRLIFPAVVLGALIAVIGVTYLAAPGLAETFLSRFRYIFFPQGQPSMTITEIQPLFRGFDITAPTESRVWSFFSTGFFIAPIAMVLIFWSLVKEFKAEKLFFLCWSILMLAAMLGQNRFAYYFAINMAVLGGYFGWRLLGWVAWVFKKTGLTERPEVEKNHRPHSPKALKNAPPPVVAKTRNTLFGYISAALAVVLGFFLILFPNISLADDASKIEIGPNNDWHDALLWMRENTPEPFDDPAYFNRLYVTPPEGEDYQYPESAYGVMSGWDYGHWITTIAHRIPVTNPHQFGADWSSAFMIAPDETKANRIMDDLDSRFVIIDIKMVTSLFFSYPIWQNESEKEYLETLYQANKQGVVEPRLFFYPQYYQSISTRLYNFLGQSVVPQNTTTVITCENRIDDNGREYKLITSSRQFPTYAEAEAYSKVTAGSRIGGTDPFISPVPLEKMEHYKLVYGSDTIVANDGGQNISYVEIFEYQP